MLLVSQNDFYIEKPEVKGKSTALNYDYLNNEIKNYNKLSEDELTQLLSIRKNELLKDVKNDPAAFKKGALPKDLRDNLPQKAQQLVEKEIEIDVRITILHSDDFTGKKSEDSYRAKDKEGKRYNIYFSKEPKGVDLRSNIRLKGLILDSEIAVDSAVNVDQRQSLTQPLTGARNTLVIRYNWQNDTSQPILAATLNTNIFAEGGSSANEYFQEVSYSQISFPGDVTDVTDWYTIAYNSSTGCSTSIGGDVDDWAAAADAAATAGGHNLANYEHLIYVFPDNPSCGWAGLGTVGDDWDGKYRIWSNEYDDNWLFTHELGHNIRAGHANTKDCGTKSIDIYANCTNTEYGDRYDTMGGYAVTYHMNAPFKNKGEWLVPSEVQTASASGTYTINPLENSGSVVKGIKIAKADTGENYWLEYRQATGLDSALPTGVTRGLTIRIYDDDLSYSDSYLLDLTPGVGSPSDWSDIALSDGVSFTDQTNNITITQTSHNASGVNLSIDIGSSPVYRFWSNTYRHHFYTVSSTEKDYIVANYPTNIWQYEGPVFRAYPDQEVGTSPVYRFWSNTYKGHFYTISSTEKDYVIANYPNDVWQYEGVAYYAYQTNVPETSPVYRFWSNTYKGHFYTISSTEKDYVIATYPTNVWQYEGIGFFTIN